MFEGVRAALASVPAGKLVNMAVFDHHFQGKPKRPPLATLAWKDWKDQGQGPEIRRLGDPSWGLPPAPSATSSVPPVPPATSFVPPPPAAPSFPAPAAHVPSVIAAPAPAPLVSQVVAAPPRPPSIAPAPLVAVSRPPAPAPLVVPPPAPAPLAPATAIAVPAQFAPAPLAPAPEPLPTALPTAPAPFGEPIPSAPFGEPIPSAPFGEPIPSAPPSRPSFPAVPANRASVPSVPGSRLSGDELITTLFEAMHDLNFLRDPLEGADFVLALLMDKLPSTVGFVHFYDINSQEFVVVRAVGPGAIKAVATRTPEKDPLIAEAMRTRRAIVIAEASADERAQKGRWAMIDTACRSLVCAPVEQGGRFLGFLELSNPRDGGPFREGDGHALTYIGEQFAEFLAARGIVLHPDRLTPPTGIVAYKK
jgi:putative methionine-R-sulfoxide reductase with GAF domain